MKKEKEIYELTLKGLLCISLGNDELAKKAIDDIELYLRRHYSKEGHPGIVLNLDNNEFEFVTLNMKEDE